MGVIKSTVTKKEEHLECFQAPCLTPPLVGPVRPLRGTVCLLLPWLATARWLPCRTYTMQLAITQTETTRLMPHNTTNNWTRDLRFSTSVVHRHRQISRTDTVRFHKSTSRVSIARHQETFQNLLVLYFTENIPTAQTSWPLPSSILFSCSQIRS